MLLEGRTINAIIFLFLIDLMKRIIEYLLDYNSPIECHVRDYQSLHLTTLQKLLLDLISLQNNHQRLTNIRN